MWEAIQKLFKNACFVGGTSAKILGLGITLYGLKKIWSNEKRKDPLSVKIILSALYIFHLFSISLAACVLFGFSFISAPLATALVSGSAFLKSFFDYSATHYHYYNTEIKLSRLKQTLTKYHINLDKNKLFLEDLKSCANEIRELEEKHNRVSLFLEKVKLPIKTNSQTKEIQEILSSVENNFDIIKQFTQHFEKLNLSPANIVALAKSDSQHKLASKENLNKQLKQLEIDGFASNKNKEKIKLLSEKLKKLENEINRLTVIKQYFKEIEKSQKIIDQLKQKLKAIQEKYKKSSYSTQEKDQYQLKRQYLITRMRTLKRKVTRELNLRDSSPFFQGKNKRAFNSNDQLQYYLKWQMNFIKSRLGSLRKSYQNKTKYFSLFSDTEHYPKTGDYQKIYTLIKRAIETKNELALMQINTNSQRKNTHFSAITATIAIFLCFAFSASVSSILSPLMLIIGITSSLSSLFDFHAKYLFEASIPVNELTEMWQLITLKRISKNSMNISVAPTMAKTTSLSSIIKTLENNQSLAAETERHAIQSVTNPTALRHSQLNAKKFPNQVIKMPNKPTDKGKRLERR